MSVTGGHGYSSFVRQRARRRGVWWWARLLVGELDPARRGGAEAALGSAMITQMNATLLDLLVSKRLTPLTF